MYGNILNNTQIHQLRQAGALEISPFFKDRMRLAHYPLGVSTILDIGDVGPGGKRKKATLHDFSAGDPFTFAPNQYAVVEVEEFIKLSEGIVGHFVPASALIEQGFGITAGKLDPGYGGVDGRRQQIRFGVKNLKNEPNLMFAELKIAYIYFVDLRGLNNQAFQWTPAELALILSRGPRLARDSDDGVNHGDGSGKAS